VIYKLNSIIIRLTNPNHNSFSPMALGTPAQRTTEGIRSADA